MKLVEQPCSEALLGDVFAADHRHIPVTRRRFRLLNGLFEPISNELDSQFPFRLSLGCFLRGDGGSGRKSALAIRTQVHSLSYLVGTPTHHNRTDRVDGLLKNLAVVERSKIGIPRARSAVSVDDEPI